MKSHEVLVKVSRAMQRGTLPANLTVKHSANMGVELQVPRMTGIERELTDEQTLLAWLQRTFGEGTSRRDGIQALERRLNGRRHWFDCYRWWIDGVPVEAKFLVPHEHDRAWLRGVVNSSGVHWVCTQCRQPITKTLARELGLLPPRIPT